MKKIAKVFVVVTLVFAAIFGVLLIITPNLEEIDNFDDLDDFDLEKDEKDDLL